MLRRKWDKVVITPSTCRISPLSLQFSTLEKMLSWITETLYNISTSKHYHVSSFRSFSCFIGLFLLFFPAKRVGTMKRRRFRQMKQENELNCSLFNYLRVFFNNNKRLFQQDNTKFNSHMTSARKPRANWWNVIWMCMFLYFWCWKRSSTIF